MSGTTRYPDGPYLVTYNDGHQRADMLRTSISGAQYICGTTPDWLIERGCTLTPLVPAPTEPTLDEMVLAISERKLPFVLQGWGRTWWVDYWDNRTVDQPTPSEAIRAAWEAVCKP